MPRVGAPGKTVWAVVATTGGWHRLLTGLRLGLYGAALRRPARLFSLTFNLDRSLDPLILVHSRDSRAAVLHASRCRATSREGTAAGEESRR